MRFGTFSTTCKPKRAAFGASMDTIHTDEAIIESYILDSPDGWGYLP